MPPTRVIVCDMGRRPVDLAGAMYPLPYELSGYAGRCLAASWNWFIANTDEDRILVCEDFVLGPYAIGQLVMTPGPFVGTLRADYCYGCFVIRRECVERVGPFDEALSPNYVYFEDCDHRHRMKLAGLPVAIAGDVTHVGQGTLAAYSLDELAAHHKKFLLAQNNYVDKWGGLPLQEIYTTPYGPARPMEKR